MKTTQSRAFAGCLLCLGLPLAIMPPLRAEVRESPLLLIKHGSYIELEEGAFRRSESIETLSGAIFYSYEKNGQSLKSDRLPLTPKGLAEFKSLNRTELEGSECKVNVVIYINGGDHTLAVSKGEDPIKNWEPFAAAVNKAMEQMKKLMVISSPARGPRVIQPPKP